MLKKLLIYTVIIFTISSTLSFAQEYDRKEALASLINPHEQINDEGSILWGKCLICHPEVPDIKKAKSIKDVKLRFEDDLKQGCFRCHPQVMHPGGAWTGSIRGKAGAPNHWIKPPEVIANNIRISIENDNAFLPLEPKTGKIFCGTCHNPHERGLLIGKADYGADHDRRLRSAGLPICTYCHRR